MTDVTFEFILDQPRAEVWARLEDLLTARHYVPGVKDIQYNTERHQGVGASRKVLMEKGSPIDETVAVWSEGYGYTLTLHLGDRGAPPPFRQAAFIYGLKDVTERETRVTGILRFEMRWGVLGWLLGRLLTPVMRKRQQEIGARMQRYYETSNSGQASNRGQ